MKPDTFDMLTCTQCGTYGHKTNHRRYYASQVSTKDSYYKQCKKCERINKRYFYLKKKETLTEKEQEEVTVTEQLYKELKARGMETPGYLQENPAKEMLAEITKGREHPQPVEVVNLDSTPEEIVSFLGRDLSGSDVEKLYAEYDALREKYMPVLSTDELFNPVHDTTYKTELEAVLQRIYDYEESIYGEGDK